MAFCSVTLQQVLLWKSNWNEIFKALLHCGFTIKRTDANIGRGGIRLTLRQQDNELCKDKGTARGPRSWQGPKQRKKSWITFKNAFLGFFLRAYLWY